MKLLDYINDCLRDPEFKKYWEEEDFSYLKERKRNTRWSFITNTLDILNENDLEDIVKNKGVRANIDVGTTIEFF